jgi:ribonuclease HI
MNQLIAAARKNKAPVDAKIHPRTEYTLFFDGCSKGNPGPAGAGAVLYRGEEEISALSKYLGDPKTNNEAEYMALIIGLQHCLELKIDELTVYGDSELVIKQVNGEYSVKSPTLLVHFDVVMTLKKCFKSVVFIHVKREQNQRADLLSNSGLKM